MAVQRHQRHPSQKILKTNEYTHNIKIKPHSLGSESNNREFWKTMGNIYTSAYTVVENRKINLQTRKYIVNI